MASTTRPVATPGPHSDRGRRDPERNAGQQQRKAEADDIAERLAEHAVMRLARRDVQPFGVVFGHGSVPIR